MATQKGIEFQPGLFPGHPRGLPTLFFTEMWERFSYYGMRALLTLYLTGATIGANPGLGFDLVTAGAIYGLYTSFVYLLALPGGWVADQLWGAAQGGIRRRLHHRGGSLQHGDPDSVHVLPGTGPHRHRHGAAQAQRELRGGRPLPRGRSAPRRRVLDLLHGHQRGRARRPLFLRPDRRVVQLAPGVLAGGNRHDRRPDLVPPRLPPPGRRRRSCAPTSRPMPWPAPAGRSSARAPPSPWPWSRSGCSCPTARSRWAWPTSPST